MKRQFRDFEERYGAGAVARQSAYWSDLALSSVSAYAKSAEPHRTDLMQSIGIPDDLQKRQAVRLIQSQRVRALDGVNIYRWVLEMGNTGLQLEALVGSPRDRREPFSTVVVYYDAPSSPEKVMGMTGSKDDLSAYGLALARKGYLVLVPCLITTEGNTYEIDKSGIGLGMRLLGLEIGLTMRALDYLIQRPYIDPDKISAFGVGVGGVMASYLGACDPRINTTINIGGFLSHSISTRPLELQDDLYLLMISGETLFPEESLPRLIAPRPLFIGDHLDDRFKRTADPAPIRAVYDRLGIPRVMEFRPMDLGITDYLKPSLDFLKRRSPPSLPKVRSRPPSSGRIPLAQEGVAR
jgi:dienelactone hydrolase